MPEEPRWLDDAQQQVWRAYLDGSSALMTHLDQDLRQFGLSLPEYEVLVRLSEAPDHQIRMAELAASVQQSRSRLTHTVARMQRDGLVERVSCASDRRGVWARLTRDGWHRLTEAAPRHVACVRSLLVDAVSRADLEAVGRVFSAVADRVATAPGGCGTATA